ncbi:MAG TPA: hypothetical protein PLS67_01720 [Accumulibacter sp.]|jgi:hypothetical protein|nr:hypothetical protein [Accumulibacter sp.]HQC79222.1 hypothetical protein [Accumulibacter sp.]
MTGFCGYFNRREKCDASQNKRVFRESLARARSSLSRDPNHQRHEHVDVGERLFLVTFDNGAWWQGGFFRNEPDDIAWVSGNPLVPDSDGVSNDPKNSAWQVAKALATDTPSALIKSAGSFCAVSWLSSRNILRLCADKIALRPVYVYLDEDSCFFATSIRVLRSLLPMDLEVDDSGIAEFIYFSQNLGRKTIFKNVEVLTPGGILEIGRATIRRTAYFSWNDVPARKADFADCSRELYRLFMIATRRRAQGCTEVDAFLTGGMDSRSVVAALLDCGLRVRAFNYSYPKSADDVLGRMLAEKLPIDYFCYHSNPRDRLKINADYFALNAKIHFPPRTPHSEKTGRVIWSGDGGSVGLGHVYMTEETAALASGPTDEKRILKLFPGLDRPISRMVRRRLVGCLRSSAIDAMVEHWKSINPRQPSRKIFIYYLLNDQMRHLYHHYEQIDLSGIEFEMPFFDMDFLCYIASLDIDVFLRHKIYNHWLSEFAVPVDTTPWQAYPGHEPCPLPMPEHMLSQWATNWYGGETGANVAKEILDMMLDDSKSAVWKYLDKKWLLALSIVNRLGVRGYNYESDFARKVYEEIGGKLVFDLPK